MNCSVAFLTLEIAGFHLSSGLRNLPFFGQGHRCQTLVIKGRDPHDVTCEFSLHVIENEEGDVFKIVALALFLRGHSTTIAVDA